MSVCRDKSAIKLKILIIINRSNLIPNKSTNLEETFSCCPALLVVLPPGQGGPSPVLLGNQSRVIPVLFHRLQEHLVDGDGGLRARARVLRPQYDGLVSAGDPELLCGGQGGPQAGGGQRNAPGLVCIGTTAAFTRHQWKTSMGFQNKTGSAAAQRQREE